MNLCHLACYYRTSALYQQLFENLVSKEVEISQRVVSPRGFAGKNIDHPGINFTGENLWGPLDRIWLPRKIRTYVNYVNEQVPLSSVDLIHAHSLYSDGFAAYSLWKKHGIPYVITVRNTDVNVFARFGRHLDQTVKKVIVNARKIVFVNNQYRVQLGRYLRMTLPESDCVTIPNGVDAYWLNEDSTSIPVDSSSIRLVCVGNVQKNKNQALLTEAVIQYNSRAEADLPRISLTIVGDSSSPYARKLRSRHESKDIVFTGVLKKHEIRKVYLNSDIFTLVSFSENFGLVYAEALSTGLPVIYTRGQGFDGWEAEGQWGYSCAPDSVEELVQKITILGASTRLSHEQIQKVKSRFDWSAIARSYLKTYHPEK